MRLFAVIGFSYAACLLMGTVLGFSASLILAAVCFTGAILLFFVVKPKQRIRYAAAALSAAAAFGMFALHSSLNARELTLNQKECRITGVVTSCKTAPSGYTRATVQTTKIQGPDGKQYPQSVTVHLFPEDSGAVAVHDQVSFTAVITVQEESPSLGQSRWSLWAEQIRDLLPQGVSRSVSYYADQARNAFQSAAAPYLDDNAEQILSGLVFGGTDGVERELSVLFRQGGVLHVLSVSGFHLAVIAQALFLLLSRLRVPRKVLPFLILGFVLCFMALAGFRYSVLRAGIMTAVAYLAPLFRREADPLNSLGLAALVITVIDPASVRDVGFLLSFSATLGILLCAGPISRWLTSHLPSGHRLTRAAIQLFSVSFSATLFTLPVSILCFSSLSLVGLFSNLFLYPLFFALLCGGFLFYLICLIPFLAWLAQGIGWLMNTCVTALLASLNFFSALPGSSIPLGYGFVKIGLLSCCLLLILWAALRKRKKIPLALCCACCVFLLLAGTGSYLICNHNVVEVTAINSYNGSCVLVTGRSSVSLIALKADRYLFSQTAEFLLSRGIRRLHTLVILQDSPEADHFGTELLVAYPAEQVVYSKDSMSFMGVSSICEKEEIPSFPLTSMELSLSPQTSFSCYQTDEGFGVSVNSPGGNVAVTPNFSDLERMEQSRLFAAAVVSDEELFDLNLLSTPRLLNLTPPDNAVYTTKAYYAPEQASVSRILIRDNGAIQIHLD